MSDKIREAFDAWIASVDKRRDANGWQPLTARDVNMLREGYMEAALAQQPAAAVPEGWKLVPVERIQAAIEAVQNAMLDAYSNAYQECCGRGQGQCCGDPDAAWSAEDQRIMDALAPAQRELSALLAAAPAAPVAVKPCGGCGATDESQRCIGCMHQFAPPAAEQPDASAQLASIEAMCAMVEAREWADHAGVGEIGRRVEHAISTLRNELQEAQSTAMAERCAVRVPPKLLDQLRDACIDAGASATLAKLNALLDGEEQGHA